MIVELFRILVTVTVVGHQPMVELLPKEYAASDNHAKCQEAVNELFPRLRRKGLTVKLECVAAKTRGV